MVCKGVVYIVIGDIIQILYATCSILSLRKSGYKGPIVILTDLNHPSLARIKNELNVTIKHASIPRINARNPSRWVKTQLLKFSPFKETLYLDTDTIILRPIDKIWSWLKKENIAMCLDFNSKHVYQTMHSTKKELNYTLSGYPPDSKEYNTGVLLFKKSKSTQKLFKEWHKEWLLFKDIDQLALVRAIYNTKINPAVLPNKFNMLWWVQSPNLKSAHKNKTVIWHFGGAQNMIWIYNPRLYKQASKIIQIRFPQNYFSMTRKYLGNLKLRLLKKIFYLTQCNAQSF